MLLSQTTETHTAFWLVNGDVYESIILKYISHSPFRVLLFSYSYYSRRQTVLLNLQQYFEFCRHHLGLSVTQSHKHNTVDCKQKTALFPLYCIPPEDGQYVWSKHVVQNRRRTVQSLCVLYCQYNNNIKHHLLHVARLTGHHQTADSCSKLSLNCR